MKNYILILCGVIFLSAASAEVETASGINANTIILDAKRAVKAYATSKSGDLAKPIICYNGGIAAASIKMLEKLGLNDATKQSQAMGLDEKAYATISVQLRDMDMYCFGLIKDLP